MSKEKAPSDFNDLMLLHNLEPKDFNAQVEAGCAKWEAEQRASTDAQSTKGKPVVITFGALLDMEIEERSFFLDPVIPEEGLVMVYAPRGTGKTHVGMSLAMAIADGGEVFGKWYAPRPRKVLYLDGEMPLGLMRKRADKYVDCGYVTERVRENLKLFTPGTQKENNFHIPNLARKEDRDSLEEYIEEADVIFIDSISTLAKTRDSNSEDEWREIQDWLVCLRNRKKSVVLMHHTNRQGGSRGTLAREDVLDNVISLSRPIDYQEAQGARFVVEFTKARDIWGEQAASFEAWLRPDTGIWETSPVTQNTSNNATAQRVLDMAALGHTQQKIAETLGAEGVKISQPTISRILKANAKQAIFPEFESEA